MKHTITKQGYDNLLELRNFIANKVIDSKWDFSSWGSGPSCALGHLPTLKPSKWERVANFHGTYPRLRRSTSGITSIDARNYFGISENIFDMLFIGYYSNYSQTRKRINGGRISKIKNTSSRERWIAHCDKFLNLLEIV